MPESRSFNRLLAIAFLSILFAACSPSDNEPGEEDDAVTADIVVDHDSYFGIPNGTAIGDIWFSDSIGMIGTPVRIILNFQDQYFKKFKGVELSGLIVLTNTDATKDGFLEKEFTVNSLEEQFDLIIPQVKTIPSVIDFDISITAVNPDDETEEFQVTTSYQFLVNKGAPAT